MCHAIIKIDYKSPTEPHSLVVVENADDLLPKIEEVQRRPEVRKVTWFIRHMSREVTQTWHEETYNV